MLATTISTVVARCYYLFQSFDEPWGEGVFYYWHIILYVGPFFRHGMGNMAPSFHSVLNSGLAVSYIKLLNL